MRLCEFRFSEPINISLHISHACGLTSLWILLCVVRLPAKLNVWLQTSHWYNFLAVCVRLCCWRVNARPNALLQIPQTCGLSPLWVCWCLASSLGFLKVWQHSWHFSGFLSAFVLQDLRITSSHISLMYLHSAASVSWIFSTLPSSPLISSCSMLHSRSPFLTLISSSSTTALCSRLDEASVSSFCCSQWSLIKVTFLFHIDVRSMFWSSCRPGFPTDVCKKIKSTSQYLEVVVITCTSVCYTELFAML